MFLPEVVVKIKWINICKDTEIFGSIYVCLKKNSPSEISQWKTNTVRYHMWNLKEYSQYFTITINGAKLFKLWITILYTYNFFKKHRKQKAALTVSDLLFCAFRNNRGDSQNRPGISNLGTQWWCLVYQPIDITEQLFKLKKTVYRSCYKALKRINLAQCLAHSKWSIFVWMTKWTWVCLLQGKKGFKSWQKDLERSQTLNTFHISLSKMKKEGISNIFNNLQPRI